MLGQVVRCHLLPDGSFRKIQSLHSCIFLHVEFPRIAHISGWRTGHRRCARWGGSRRLRGRWSGRRFGTRRCWCWRFSIRWWWSGGAWRRWCRRFRTWRSWRRRLRTRWGRWWRFSSSRCWGTRRWGSCRRSCARKKSVSHMLGQVVRCHLLPDGSFRKIQSLHSRIFLHVKFP
jgi:hypothetical protein